MRHIRDATLLILDFFKDSLLYLQQSRYMLYFFELCLKFPQTAEDGVVTGPMPESEVSFPHWLCWPRALLFLGGLEPQLIFALMRPPLC